MIDFDILQVRILTSLGAFSFAKYLYLYGRNSPLPAQSVGDSYELLSLHKMATTQDREAAVPFYTEFVEYHDDTAYADKAVMEALEGEGKWGSTGTEARTEVVALTCAYQITYMYALAEMADAIADCKSENPLDNVGGVHSWDEVAAFLIGSLEGPTGGGSPDIDDGQLLWNLANKRAFQFQTQNSEGYSRTNSELEDLLFSGRGELDAFACGNLEKTVSRIQHWLLIPVIQSTLRFAIENSRLSESAFNSSLAEGEMFALSALPIIQSYDEAAATVIEENMIMRSGVKPVVNGPQAVADAFYEAMDEFGISCEYVGASSQVDACSKQGGAKESFSTTSGAICLHATVYRCILGAITIAASMIS
jgi:Low iron-inducible periplasmic protein